MNNDPTRVALVKEHDNVPYPSPPYSPHIAYPEYQWMQNGSSTTEPNHVYDMVRQALFLLGLDQKQFGNKSWNPLAEMINPGDKVLIKPNLVFESDQSNGCADCIVTHGAVVRAVADYAILAMKDKGRLILGDAPMPTSSFERVLQVSGLNNVINFYRNHGVALNVQDLRSTVMKKGRFGPWKKFPNNNGGSVLVDLNQLSAFCPLDGFKNNYKATCHDSDTMETYHADGYHKYIIAKSVLDSDVIINIAKMKTHYKAGITGALKNSIGINASKDCLPHHRSGTPADSGDEYRKASKLKLFCSKMKYYENNSNMPISKHALHYVSSICWNLARLLCLDSTWEGSWSGNDTLWRTIVDINRILLFADKEGQIQQEPQRKVFYLIDGIVAGEGNGPLEPTPRPAGIIMAGFFAPAVDAVMATVMGLDWQKIPSICECLQPNMSLRLSIAANDIMVISNRKALCGYLNLNHRIFSFSPAKHWESLRL